jgi:hypothetical protein
MASTEELDQATDRTLRMLEEFKARHPEAWKEARRKKSAESSRRYLLGQKRKKRRGF